METTLGREKQIAAKAAQMKLQAEKFAGIKKNMPATFSASLVYLMRKKKLTVASLSEAARMSERKLQNLRNDEECFVDLDTVVALCIGMELPRRQIPLSALP